MVSAKLEIGGEELVERLKGPWAELCQQNSSAPFHRPEWIAAYLQAFEPEGEVVLLTASRKGQLVAVLPLVRKRCWFAGVPVCKLSGTANIHSVRFDTLRSRCPAGEAGMREIWNLLQRMPGWHVLELPLIPENAASEGLLSCARADGFLTMNIPFHESPILRLQEDGQGQLSWLEDTSRHFRHELRRFARLLAKETGHEPKLIRRTNPEAAILKKFYELEAAGWKGQEGSAIRCTPRTQSFYDQIAREAAAGGYFSLYTLEANGEMIAGAFTVETQECLYPLKIAYQESLRRGGPGQVLFNAMLAECARRRIPALFFGGTKDRYKSSWTSETIPHYTAVVFAKGFRSQLAYRSRRWLISGLGRLRRRIRTAGKEEGEGER